MKRNDARLLKAVEARNMTEARRALENGANVNVRGDEGMTSLNIIAFDPHGEEMMRLLIKKGADPNIGDDSGTKPLHIAASTEIGIDILLESGADVNVTDENGDTPLHFAARNGTTRAVVLLLAQGADISITNNEGLTPLDVADALEKQDVADLLREIVARATKDDVA